jgi:hypothetical protein
MVQHPYPHVLIATKVTTAGSASCSKCPPGRFGNATGQTSKTSCGICVAGKYSDTEGATKCESCTGSEASLISGASICLVCTAGKYRSSSDTCLDCADGEFASAGATACTQAQPGFYTDTDQTEQIACVAGTYCSTDGATSSSTCTECVKGE